MSLEEAEKIRNTFFATYPGVAASINYRRIQRTFLRLISSILRRQGLRPLLWFVLGL